MDQQDIKNKKNSKSWKKRKQNTDEDEEGEFYSLIKLYRHEKQRILSTV